jgi:hypothetical protein
VFHKPFSAVDKDRFANWITNYDVEDKRLHISPQQFRWNPMQYPPADKKVNFFEGITSMCGAGGSALKVRLVLYVLIE